MVQYIPTQDYWGEAGRAAGQAATQTYMQQADEAALKNSMARLGEGATPRQILDAITGANTYAPKAKQEALKNYLGVANYERLERQHSEAQENQRKKNELQLLAQQNKAAEMEERKKQLETAKLAKDALKSEKDKEKELAREREIEASRVLAGQLDLPDDVRAAVADNPALTKELYKEKLKLENIGPEMIRKKMAENYIQTVEELPRMRDQLENLETAEGLVDELKFFGYDFTAPLSGYLGTRKAKELESIAFTLIDPIVKLFNPSGPIAQQKLKRIQDEYAVKATDWPWVSRGKLNALRIFAKQAYKRGQDRVALYEKYNGRPPADELKAFDQETDKIIDAMDAYEAPGTEAKLENAPPPDKFKGKTFRSKSTGKEYISDGKKWLVKK